MCLDEEIPFSDDLLAEFLHSVVTFGAVALDEVDFSEGAPSNHLDQLEVVQTDFLVGTQQVFASFSIWSSRLIVLSHGIHSFADNARVSSLAPSTLDL